MDCARHFIEYHSGCTGGRLFEQLNAGRQLLKVLVDHPVLALGLCVVQRRRRLGRQARLHRKRGLLDVPGNCR